MAAQWWELVESDGRLNLAVWWPVAGDNPELPRGSDLLLLISHHSAEGGHREGSHPLSMANSLHPQVGGIFCHDIEASKQGACAKC